MTDKKDPHGQPEADRAKGAAQEAIGKLIGDDAAVRKGRAVKSKAERSASRDTD